MNDQFHPDETPEARHTRASDGYAWRGKPLPYAWSFLRKTAARELGMKYGFVAAESQIKIPNPRKALLPIKIHNPEGLHVGSAVTNYIERESKSSLTPEEIAKIEAEPDELTIYDMTRDIGILLWLCHQDREICKQARRTPSQYEDEIDEFCELHGINSSNQPDLMAFIGIINDEQQSLAIPDPKVKASGDESGNATAPQPKRGSRAKSR